MGNDNEADEHDEGAPTPLCGYCRTPLVGMSDQATYCNRRCKERAREKRKRGRARVEILRAKYPSLEDLYARAMQARPVVNDDVSDDDQDDEAGHLDDKDDGYHEADEGPGAWSDAWRLHEAVERAQRRYERAMQPYRAQMHRNPGVRPAGDRKSVV